MFRAQSEVNVSNIWFLSTCSLISVVSLFIHRRKRQTYLVENDEFSSLTYANPTYQKTSTETINVDRGSLSGSQEWRIFKFNKKKVRTSLGFLCKQNQHPLPFLISYAGVNC